ncbi:hypothetical protein [Agromyces sp. S2-1-8]|uniref:hypothetical protein n=1 Tax=unclassified Agromyces TaxID=2639701 RepID=UPI001E2A7DE6|nr:hypothetical protein [Agromyces sp. S2-1-8]MCD5344935.1 hypothetical protein [Agromyces sp. S2-1-8]
MAENSPWRLEDFVDSLVVELDKTRETLAVKAINKPLSYSVKEVALDVNAFPSYADGSVRFVTAQPGEEGASKLTIQLNSITDQQVRASTKARGTAPVDAIDPLEVDEQTRTKLRRIGVNSLDDLKELEARKVDLGAVTDSEIDYSQIARKIQQSRRSKSAPSIDGVSLSQSEGGPVLLLEGRNLAVDASFEPVAVLNGELVEVLSRGPAHLSLLLDEEHPLTADNEVVVTFDQFAVVRVNVRA